MSYDFQKERSKQIQKPDKWQLTGGINPCSQLHISPLRVPAHGWEIEYYLWYVMEIEENKLRKEWWARQAINIKN